MALRPRTHTLITAGMYVMSRGLLLWSSTLVGPVQGGQVTGQRRLLQSLAALNHWRTC